MSVADECCVCMDALVDGGSIRTLACGHTLHAHCLGTWEAKLINGGRSARCPICQREYGPKPPPIAVDAYGGIIVARIQDIHRATSTPIKSAILLALTSSVALVLAMTAWAASALAFQGSE